MRGKPVNLKIEQQKLFDMKQEKILQTNKWGVRYMQNNRKKFNKHAT